MNISPAEFEYMKEGLVKDMAMLLIEEHGMNMTEALDAIYLSDTYAKLCDSTTGLYYQSARYILTFLIAEIEIGTFVPKAASAPRQETLGESEEVESLG